MDNVLVNRFYVLDFQLSSTNYAAIWNVQIINTGTITTVRSLVYPAESPVF